MPRQKKYILTRIAIRAAGGGVRGRRNIRRATEFAFGGKKEYAKFRRSKPKKRGSNRSLMEEILSY